MEVACNDKELFLSSPTVEHRIWWLYLSDGLLSSIPGAIRLDIDKENAFLYNTVNLQNLLPSALIWNQDTLGLNLKNWLDRSVKPILKQYFERSHCVNESGKCLWDYSELSVGVSHEKQLNIHIMYLVDSQYGRSSCARPVITFCFHMKQSWKGAV